MSPNSRFHWLLFSLQDDFPLASLPLLGYSVTTPSETDNIHKDYVFKLQFKNHVYFFRAESEYTFERWETCLVRYHVVGEEYIGVVFEPVAPKNIRTIFGDIIEKHFCKRMCCPEPTKQLAIKTHNFTSFWSYFRKYEIFRWHFSKNSFCKLIRK